MSSFGKKGNKLFMEKQKSLHGSSAECRNVQSNEFTLSFSFLKLQLVDNSLNQVKKYQAASELLCFMAHFIIFLTISFMAKLNSFQMPNTRGTNKSYKSLWS